MLSRSGCVALLSCVLGRLALAVPRRRRLGPDSVILLRDTHRVSWPAAQWVPGVSPNPTNGGVS